MFSNIMIPVDLTHTDQLDKALAVAAEFAKHEHATAHIVGVTQSSPTEVAKTPEAYAERLAAFAAQQSASLGVTFVPHTEVSHDPAIDIDDVLAKAAEKIGADLIIMASHVPGFADRIFASRAGYLASHSSLSVFIVR